VRGSGHVNRVRNHVEHIATTAVPNDADILEEICSRSAVFEEVRNFRRNEDGVGTSFEQLRNHDPSIGIGSFCPGANARSLNAVGVGGLLAVERQIDVVERSAIVAFKKRAQLSLFGFGKGDRPIN